MKLPRQLLKAKLTRAKELAFAKGLQDGSSEDFKIALEEVDRYTKLLAATAPVLAGDSLAAALVVCVVLAGVGVLWTTKIPQPDVFVAAKTSRLHLRTSGDWKSQSTIPGSEFHLSGFTELSDPGLGLSVNGAKGETSLQLVGGRLALEEFSVGKKGDVSLISDRNELRLAFSGAAVSGVISASGKVLVIAEVDGRKVVHKSLDLSTPETIEFSSPDGRFPKASVMATGAWSLGMIPYASLDFSSIERSGTEWKTIFGLLGGSLKFNDSSRPVIQLLGGERLSILSIPKGDGALIQILRSGDGMDVTLSGLVEQVTIGNYEKYTAPSYLDYIYSRKTFGFFCAAMVSGWGLLWGIRKTLFR